MSHHSQPDSPSTIITSQEEDLTRTPAPGPRSGRIDLEGDTLPGSARPPSPAYSQSSPSSTVQFPDGTRVNIDNGTNGAPRIESHPTVDSASSGHFVATCIANLKPTAAEQIQIETILSEAHSEPQFAERLARRGIPLGVDQWARGTYAYPHHFEALQRTHAGWQAGSRTMWLDSDPEEDFEVNNRAFGCTSPLALPLPIAGSDGNGLDELLDFSRASVPLAMRGGNNLVNTQHQDRTGRRSTIWVRRAKGSPSTDTSTMTSKSTSTSTGQSKRELARRWSAGFVRRLSGRISWVQDPSAIGSKDAGPVKERVTW